MAQREWLEEFILLYQSEPSLWKIKSKDYHNRVIKDSAYEKLILKLREIDPKSNKEAVIKKINNLRCTYNKERKKVMASKSGSGAEDLYEPKLWYYPLLRFLDDQNLPRPSRSNLDEGDEINVMESSDATSVSENEAALSELDVTENLSAPSPTASTSITASTSSGHGLAPKRQTKRKSNEDLTKDVLQSVQDHFKRPTYQEDRYDIIGKMVALKLREFKNKQQQLLAEKIINETLFEAEMGNLTMSHRVMAPRTMILNDVRSRSSSSTSITSPIQYTGTPNQSPIHQRQYYQAGTLAPQMTNILSQTNTSSYGQEIQEAQAINAMGDTTVQLSIPDWTEETAGSYVSRFNQQ